MRKCVFGQNGVVSACFYYDIVFGRLAFGHKVIGYVGHGVEQLRAFLFGLFLQFVEVSSLLLYLFHLLLGSRCLFLFPLFHQGADLFRKALE